MKLYDLTPEVFFKDGTSIEECPYCDGPTNLRLECPQCDFIQLDEQNSSECLKMVLEHASTGEKQ